MGLFDRFAQLFGGNWHSSGSGPDLREQTAINPATGLPMVGGQGGVDVAGNPFGTDLHRHRDDDWSRHDRWEMEMSFDSSTRWHDPCSSGGIGGGHDPWHT